MGMIAREDRAWSRSFSASFPGSPVPVGASVEVQLCLIAVCVVGSSGSGVLSQRSTTGTISVESCQSNSGFRELLHSRPQKRCRSTSAPLVTRGPPKPFPDVLRGCYRLYHRSRTGNRTRWLRRISGRSPGRVSISCGHRGLGSVALEPREGT